MNIIRLQDEVDSGLRTETISRGRSSFILETVRSFWRNGPVATMPNQGHDHMLLSRPLDDSGVNLVPDVHMELKGQCHDVTSPPD